VNVEFDRQLFNFDRSASDANRSNAKIALLQSKPARVASILHLRHDRDMQGRRKEYRSRPRRFKRISSNTSLNTQDYKTLFSLLPCLVICFLVLHARYMQLQPAGLAC
jgi:hypothetical protein